MFHHCRARWAGQPSCKVRRLKMDPLSPEWIVACSIHVSLQAPNATSQNTAMPMWVPDPVLWCLAPGSRDSTCLSPRLPGDTGPGVLGSWGAGVMESWGLSPHCHWVLGSWRPGVLGPWCPGLCVKMGSRTVRLGAWTSWGGQARWIALPAAFASFQQRRDASVEV